MKTKNIHFNKDVRDLTIKLWLQGKSHEQIKAAIYAHRSQRRLL